MTGQNVISLHLSNLNLIMISISQQGTQVMSGIYEIMHDPDYWKDPEVFRPGETKNLPFSMLQKEQIYIERDLNLESQMNKINVFFLRTIH